MSERPIPVRLPKTFRCPGEVNHPDLQKYGRTDILSPLRNGPGAFAFIFFPRGNGSRETCVDKGDVTIRLFLPNESDWISAVSRVSTLSSSLISHIYPTPFPFDFHDGNMERVYALSGFDFRAMIESSNNIPILAVSRRRRIFREISAELNPPDRVKGPLHKMMSVPRLSGR